MIIWRHLDFRIEKLNDKLQQTFVGNIYRADEEELLDNTSRTGRL